MSEPWLEGLNESQRRAAEHDAGPMIVLAGPGTGKTRVIVRRVARLIARDHRDPESILAVTFTVRAAEQLRERLAEFIDPGLADRVQTHTFHGLGVRLLNRFGDLIGMPANPTLIDSSLRRRLLHDLVRTHRLFPDHIGLGYEAIIAEGLRFVEECRHAAILPGDALAHGDLWRARIDAGDLGKSETLASETARHERFVHLAQLYRLFDEACLQRGWMTYDDQIIRPIELLRKHEGARAICNAELRHIVVDEFQDVNQAQIQLLRLLAPAGASAGPDLCVVGDDDQAIYAFRGADDRAFRHFAQHWPGYTTIELSTNYRSMPEIVRSSNYIIGQADDRFAPDKTIEPDPTVCSNGKLESIVAPDEQHGEVICAAILAARRSEAGRPWRDYAVIARTHADLDRIAITLLLEGIPVKRSRPASALDDAGVRDVLRWVELLSDQYAWGPAAKLLARPPFCVPTRNVTSLVQKYHAHTSRADGDDVPGFVEWLQDQADDDRACAKFVRLHDEMRDLCMEQDAASVVAAIIRRTGVVHHDLLPAAQRAGRIACLAELVRFAQSVTPMLDPPGGIAALWTYYERLDEQDKRLRSAGADLTDADLVTDEEHDAVQLITAHGAKGLEFDTVFVPRVSPPHGFPKSASRGDESLVPQELIDADDDRSDKARRMAEERRLFYVACTRAMRRLVLLSKPIKSRSSSTHFVQELTLDANDAVAIEQREASDVFREAAEAGVNLKAVPGMDLDPSDRASLDLKQMLLDRARTAARLSAADALESVERPDSEPADIERAAQILRLAAERVAFIEAIAHTGSPPDWICRSPLADEADKLSASVREASVPSPGLHFRPLGPSLELSYSHVDEFHKCPRCCYLRRFERIAEPPTGPQVVGTAVHAALQTFYQRVRQAESEGRPPPELDDLLELGRRAFQKAWPDHRPIDQSAREQILAQLERAGRSLHDSSAQVLEVELEVRWTHERKDVRHTLVAKIDRVDMLSDGSFRIVDYKTGKPKKAVSEPSKTDLQLGMYALALAAHLNQEDSPAGAAEYWQLADGVVGRIGLDALNMENIRARIDQAIDGLLDGNFEKGKACWGLCDMLDEPTPAEDSVPAQVAEPVE